MDDNSSKIIHLQPAHQPFSWHMFLLFIPAIAFAVVVALVASARPAPYESTVLGDEISE